MSRCVTHARCRWLLGPQGPGREAAAALLRAVRDADMALYGRATRLIAEAVAAQQLSMALFKPHMKQLLRNVIQVRPPVHKSFVDACTQLTVCKAKHACKESLRNRHGQDYVT